MTRALAVFSAVVVTMFAFAAPAMPQASVVLGDITWPEAEQHLTENAVVLFAYGNASKAHGPHLPLATDFLQAEYVKEQVARRTAVVVAPSVSYGYYPPFLEYPGSTTLPLSVARDLVANICRSYARNSRARRFYMLAHGQITRPVVDEAARMLAAEGILLRAADWEGGKAAGVSAVRQQERGSHADEVETSMLLYIAPDKVDMRKAVKEYGSPPGAEGRMIGNRPERDGIASPSGVFGDATLATRDKGRRITEGLIDALVKDIERLRTAPVPPAPTSVTTLALVEGDYDVAAGDTIRVAHDGDLLTVQRGAQRMVRLQAAGRYRYGLWTTEVRFLVDDNGQVTHILLSTNGRDVIARRARERQPEGAGAR